MLGELSIENLSWEKKIFMKGEQDLLGLLKKNNEKVFFQLEVSSSIKT